MGSALGSLPLLQLLTSSAWRPQMRSGFGLEAHVLFCSKAQEHLGKESTGKHSHAWRASLPQQPQDLPCGMIHWCWSPVSLF